MSFRLTHLGTATLLLEIGELRVVTDPVFDPPGGRYSFGWGTGSTKLAGPALSPEAIGRVDAVLLSHDQHGDNLDAAGRAFLPRTGRVLTTAKAARRLGGNAEGLLPWQAATLRAGGTELRVTALPSRHGPLAVRPFAGPTIGFMLEWEGQRNGALYLSGDTILYRGIRAISKRFTIDTAILHLGRAGFPLTGPIRFTLGARDGVRAAKVLAARRVVPIHFEGWEHFREGRRAIEGEFAAAGLGGSLRWLVPGQKTEMRD